MKKKVVHGYELIKTLRRELDSYELEVVATRDFERMLDALPPDFKVRSTAIMDAE